MLGCWVVCLAAGRFIGGETHGPILGAIMLAAWQFGMVFVVQTMKVDPDREVD